MENPYRPLFFLGILFAILGVIPWLLAATGIAPGYPIQNHAHIMILGFFMAFVCGFLMTALPKMTGSKPASSAEVSIVAILLVLQALFSFQNHHKLSLGVGLFQFLFLGIFLFQRFLSRKSQPPASFLFVPIGLLSGFVGLLLMMFEPVSVAGTVYAKILLYQAFLLNPIVGLGARLIPVLSRTPGALDPRLQGPRHPLSYLPLLITLNLSFAIEAFLSAPAGQLLRFITLVFVLIREFHIFKRPADFSWLGVNLKVSTLALTLPFVLIPLLPSYASHLLHLMFLGGFALVTLMVAVRVTLSHGGHSLQFEKSSPALPAIMIFVTLSAVIRTIAPFAPSHFWTALDLAIFFWLAAIAIWIWQLLPRLHLFPQKKKTL